MQERYMDVAQRMQLLSLGAAAGVVFWQPAGLKLYEKLRSFIRGEHEVQGYQEVKSPSIVELELFEKSGHLSKYRHNMFCLNQANEGELDLAAYGLRPMSCPNHIVLYQSQLRSYRDLPLKLFEFGEVFRNEASGSLQALFRMRQFCQDDSHVFAAESQIVDVLSGYLLMAQQAYRKLGFESLSFAISLRPEKRFGEDAAWDKAEDALREACRRNGLSWEELPGDGAFYGPKIELQVRDKLGRSWQLGVVQLDYVLPRRFDLKFINAQGQEEVPVILHHAVLGSLERMIGILLESFGVDLPLFLHPHEAVVLPVSEKSAEYAEKCGRLLKGRWRHALVDASSEPLGARLKKWRSKGVPYVLVVGEQEAHANLESGRFPVSLGKERVDLQEWLVAPALPLAA